MADVKSVILGEGDDFNDKPTSNYEIRYLKAGQTFRGRFLETKFYKFAQHGVYDKANPSRNIQSHACLDPKNHKDCVSCMAGVPIKIKRLVVMWDADKSEIVLRDIAKIDGLKKAVDDYGEDLTTGSFSIGLGDKGDLSVSLLSPAKAKEVGPTPTDIVLDDKFYAYAMNVRKPEDIEKLIAGKVEAKTNDDATIVRKDGEGQAPGPEGENGTKLF